MTEDLRPSRISLPRRVRRVSPEDREENEERFRKKLAELAGEEESGRSSRQPRQQPVPGSETEDTQRVDEDDEHPSIGRNLDLRT
jgi:hypothetical protein